MVTLVHRLGAGYGSVRPALDHLLARGWVCRNPGYGHPLRPEYVLTAEGARLGAACADLVAALENLDLRAVARKKWTMPVLHAIGASPTRFAEIPRRLARLTDRALAHALRDLVAGALVVREVVDGAPPSTCYTATGRGLSLIPLLADL